MDDPDSMETPGDGCHEGMLIDFHDHESITAGGVVVSAFIMFSMVVAHLLHRNHVTWLPESVVLIAIGGLFGLAIRELVNHSLHGGGSLQEYFGPINVIALNVLLLPPIMLETGWSIRRQDFLSQLEYILIFAVIGTLMSTVTICVLLMWFGLLDNWRRAFTFASLISATDPVATLATYSTLQVEPLLNVMVLGEATINDAVAIVLFRAGNGNESESASWTKLPMDVITLLIGSPMAGTLIGGFLTILVTTTKMDESHGLCGLIICVSSWFCYGLSELLGVSGIISTLFVGIVLGAFLRPNISPAMRDLVSMLLRHQACVADMVIFMLVGVFVILQGHMANIGFSVSVACLCVVSRAVSVFPLGILVNFLKRCRGRAAGALPENTHPLTPAHMVMMWHAGLRGGISMSMALELNQEDFDPHDTETLQEATFMTICIFLVIFGGSTSAMLRFLNIPLGMDMPEDALCKDRYTARGSSMVYSLARRISSRVPETGSFPLRLTRTPQRSCTGVELPSVGVGGPCGGLSRLSEESESACRDSQVSQVEELDNRRDSFR